MSFSNNLKRIMKEKKLTAEYIGNKLGVSRGTITNWSNAERFPREENHIEDLAEILGVSIQELFNPEEIEKITKNELKRNPNKYSSKLQAIKNDTQVNLTYYKDDYVCAGSSDTFNNTAVPAVMTFDKEFLKEQTDISHPEKLYVVNCIGNSMEPTIKEGSMLIINPIEKESAIISGAIYTVLYYGSSFCKRIVSNPKTGEIVLHSDNDKQHPAIKIEKDDEHEFKILGRVVAYFNFL